MLITDWEPLTVWVFTETYARLASQAYESESEELGVHLTNISVNKKLEDIDMSKTIV